MKELRACFRCCIISKAQQLVALHCTVGMGRSDAVLMR